MATPFQLKVVTPRGVLIEASVTSVRARGVGGIFEVLAHHAPMIARLGEGALDWTTADGQSRELHLAAGFLRFENNEVHLAVKRKDGE